MKSALTTLPPNLRPCSAFLAAAAPASSSYRTKTFPRPGTAEASSGRGITMLSIRPNFPHSSRMSSMISPYSTSSLSSSTSSISVSEITLDAGCSLGGGGTDAPDAAGATPARCAATSSAPGSAATPEPPPLAGCAGLGAPAPPCIARCTVSDFSPIFIPCKPWHATSVTEWSWYTKKPYPLLLPVSLSTTSWNCFVGPNASTSSLTIASVRKYGRPPMKSRCARSSSVSDAIAAPLPTPPVIDPGLRPMASRLRPSLGWDGPRLEAAMTL
mmetsp:Transcript_8156/g.32177  ORF Transcript_8156/g.32177 Transcript_8156/m.32177 type:complete len:271 (-) Transcript_8156:645-1457(-)